MEKDINSEWEAIAKYKEKVSNLILIFVRYRQTKFK